MLNVGMSPLISDRLHAFVAVAAESSFTRGAARVGITQSAVSQRISKLEDEMGLTLFLRERDLVRLTIEGQALLRFARAQEGLETEMLAALKPASTQKGLQGVVRIGGYSSITRSIIMPALSDVVRPAQELILHTFSRELSELPTLLRNGEADMVVMDRKLGGAGFENIAIGAETNVLVEPKRKLHRKDCLLDHDADDMTTQRFFEHNGEDFALDRRSFLDDIYGILDGVAAGWGRAVVSSHLVGQVRGINRVSGYEPLVTPVYLVLRRSRYRSALHREIVKTLKARCPELLAA